jgi:hypothetical protein
MMTESAKAHLNRILAETTRRKKVWANMQQAAHAAMRAVTLEARRRGVRGQNWLGGDFELDSVFVSFPSHAARRNKSLPADRRQTLSHAESLQSFRLSGSGSLERPSKTTAYEGYPDLRESDVKIFREAAVETLMAALNAHILKLRQAQRRKQ